METLDLTKKSFWASGETVVLANPRDAEAMHEAEVIREWLDRDGDLTSCLLFRTSGSSGKGKWVALSKKALLVSAKSVNDLLVVTKNDRWLQSLPLFHVGGMGIAARAYEAGCFLCDQYEKWNPTQFCNTVKNEGVSLISMVPTQLADLLRLNLGAPPSLRAVLLGGGELSDSLYERAVDLGWPVRETYGMTEAASQVATADAGQRELRILPCWEVRSAGGGQLQIRGEALLDYYVRVEDGVCSLSDPKKEGWFTTSDIGNASDGIISVAGRVDRCVKVLGELVNLGDVEIAIGEVLKKLNQNYRAFAVIAKEDARGSHELILCVEGNVDFDEVLGFYHARCNALHRIKKYMRVNDFPYTSIGKINYVALQEYDSKS